MSNDVTKTIVFLGSLAGAFYAIMRWGNHLKSILGESSSISQFDFYLSVILAGVSFYLLSKITEEVKKRVQIDKELEENIKIIEKNTLDLHKRVESAEEILRDRIVSLERGITTLNDHLFNLASKK